MNAQTLRRIWIAGLILTVLVGLDAIYMLATNYKPDDASNNTLHMTDGTTVLIAAGLLLIISIVAFVLARQAAQQEATLGTTPTTTEATGTTPTTTESTIARDDTVTGNGADVDTTARPEVQR